MLELWSEVIDAVCVLVGLIMMMLAVILAIVFND